MIDRLPHWRQRAAGGLRAAGFGVSTGGSYRLPDAAELPDLVALGCARVTDDEMRFVEKLAALGLPVVVTVTHLEPEDSRALFHRGATDVGPRPEPVAALASMVSAARASAERRLDLPERQFTAATV